MFDYPIIDVHAHVADPTVPGRIAGKAAENPDIARVFQGIHTLQQAVGYMDGMAALAPTADNLVKTMDECGISWAVIAQLGFGDMLGGIEISPNPVVLEAVRKYPDRLVGLAGVDPRKGSEAVRELETYVRDYGFKGCRINPNDWGGFFLNDRMLYPIYEKCAELGVPVHVHTGVDPAGYLKHNNPVYLDDVAMDFPKLTILMEHFGFPWVDEALAMCHKNENVYLTLAYHLNILIHKSPSLAWQTLEKMMVYCGPDKILWGSDYPATPNQKECLDFLAEATLPVPMVESGFRGLTDEDRRKILAENAARVYGLPLDGVARPAVATDESITAEPATTDLSLTWTPEAEKTLSQVPFFARGMARKAIEKYARQAGKSIVTPELMLEAKKKAGM